MSRARRIWKWSAAIIGGLLVLLALFVGTFRIWLEHSPGIGPAIVARVEQLTGIQFTFERLDARLGWYGPELVFRQARLVVPGQHEALVTARAGRVGFDLWRSIRDGRLASGRVVLEGPRIDLYVTSEGLEFRGQGALGADGRGARLALKDLPVGRLKIEDATVSVQDLRRPGPAWRADRVELMLERDPHSLAVAGRVRLPDALGAFIDLDARLTGDLGTPQAIDWQAAVELKRASIGGWTALMPQWSWLPAGGRGDLKFVATGRGVGIVRSQAQIDLKDVTMRPVQGEAPSVLKTFSGVLVVERHGTRWTATGRDLVIDTGAIAWRRGEVDLDLDWKGAALAALSLKSPAIRLDSLAALVPLLPDGAAREAGLALSPRGLLSRVDVRASRGSRPGEWRIDGGLAFHGLGLGAWRAVPGVSGLEGDLVAAGDRGRLRVGAKSLTLDLRQSLAGPVTASDAGASIDYWWRPDGWRIASDDVRARTPDGQANGKVRVWLPADAEESPRLVLDFTLRGVDARAAAKYLPAKTIPPKTWAWLEHAFLAGYVPAARLEFAGETRMFPFRFGGGVFRVRVPYEGVRLHYQDGFEDIENASGVGEFLNQGFVIHASSARIGGLAVRNGEVTLPDYLEAELSAHGHADGNVRDALAFLQSSPLGPKLGEFFMKVAGQGALSTDVALFLPFKRLAEHTVALDGRLSHVAVRVPGFAQDIEDLTGAFALHDRELTIPDMSATVLGGPAHIHARTLAGSSGVAGDRVLRVEAEGRAVGERMQPVFGITEGKWLVGSADWKFDARAPRLEWRPKPLPLPPDAPADAHPVVRDMEIRSLPLTVRLDASLAGLGIRFPAPLAKAAEVVRPLKVELAIDPGLDDEAPKAPAIFKRHDEPRDAEIIARVELGRDAGVFSFEDDDGWHLAHGTARFGGGMPVLGEEPGIWLEGRIPDYDLSAWLGVRTSAHPGRPMSDFLRGAALSVNRFSVLGFQFPDVTLKLDGRDGAWHAAVDGPAARGTVVVPWNLQGARPLALNLERIVLGERVVGSEGGEATDPRQLPAVTVAARNVEIQKRQFGALEARVSRAADGLVLDRATLKGKSFEALAHGRWAVEADAQTTTLAFTVDSTDLLDTLSAWGFEPTLASKSGHASGELRWPGGFDGDLLGRVAGHASVEVKEGQLISVDPGAGRVLGLLSVAALPRRLTLDFSDLTDKGFGFDSIKGDFEFRDGNAYTNNLAMKGPAADIGVVGRTGLKTRDYDQTAKVTGHFGVPIAAAGAFAGGPVIGAAVLLFSSVFKEQLSGIARGYYRITGNWEKPRVERIGAGQAREGNDSPVSPAPLPPSGGDEPHGGGATEHEVRR